MRIICDRAILVLTDRRCFFCPSPPHTHRKLFDDAASFNADISKWDTGNVKTMR